MSCSGRVPHGLGRPFCCNLKFEAIAVGPPFFNDLNTYIAAIEQHSRQAVRRKQVEVKVTIIFLAAKQDFGALNTPIALGIAVLKASLVVIYFMAVRYNTPLTKVVVVAGFFWLLIMFGLTMGDYLSRPLLGVPGR